MAQNISDKQKQQIDFLVQQTVTEVELGYRGFIAKNDGFYQRYNKKTTKLIDADDLQNTFTYAPLKSEINNNDFFLSIDIQKNILNRISINSIEKIFKDKYSNAVIKAQLIGEVNNTNKIFSTSVPYISGTISIYWNGINERHFIEISDTQIELEKAPLNNGYSDYLEAIFTKK